ncbi:MAG: formylglycine-generating enzyme family protein [bacterium]|nr:formylglycine-generating enzyme family protein [bacterium]
MRNKTVNLFLIFLLVFTFKLFAEEKENKLLEVISPPPARSAMILIPAGEFVMGYDSGNSDENPVHKVNLSAYYIDKYEVNNREYQKFVRETDYPPPEIWNSKEYKIFSKPDKPVVGVSWEDAYNYASWAGKRLPTEAEWEKACRGDSSLLYPWGDKKPDKSLGNFCSDKTEDVKSFPEGVSPYGVYNMLGNVWEWCNDWYDENYYKDSVYQNPSGPKITGRRVLRGGSFLCSLDILRATLRGYADPKDKTIYCGFRCAKDVK